MTTAALLQPEILLQAPRVQARPVISVILAVRNREAVIEYRVREILHSLRLSDRHGELIVVDDNSDDGTRRILGKLERSLCGLRVIPAVPTRGFAAACALGAEKARGARWLVIDIDTPFSPFMLRRLDESHGEGRAVVFSVPDGVTEAPKRGTALFGWRADVRSLLLTARVASSPHLLEHYLLARRSTPNIGVVKSAPVINAWKDTSIRGRLARAWAHLRIRWDSLMRRRVSFAEMAPVDTASFTRSGHPHPSNEMGWQPSVKHVV